MFKTIFKYEIGHWLRQPATYVFLILFFGSATVLSADHAGLLGWSSPNIPPGYQVNNTISLFSAIQQFSLFTFFLLPVFVGVAVYRDFSCRIHSVLFSYPLTKRAYLFGKFLSASLIMVLIVMTIAFGTITGFRLPGTDSSVVGPVNLVAYSQIYLIFIVPNVLILGAVIFSIVTFTRNVYAGFIAVLLLVNFQSIIPGAWSGAEGHFLREMIDSTGRQAVNYYTKYWTADEAATRLLPIGPVVILNRLLWLALGVSAFAVTFRQFSFSQYGISFRLNREKNQVSLTANANKTGTITLPTVNLDFSFVKHLRTTWHLSVFDFRFVVSSWPFIVVTAAGFLFVFFKIYSDVPAFGTDSLPFTWRVLDLPAGIITSFGTILTFLYSGMLVNRPRTYGLNQMIDSLPVPNHVLLGSKGFALVKMQIVLLALVMVSGIIVQLSKGFFDIQIGHYLFRLFVLELIPLVIWAFAALFFQVIIGNPYLGFFFLLFASMGIESSQIIGIEQDVFRPNQGPGFSYSDMGGYGWSIIPWLSYKVYWGFSALFLTGLSLLFWQRGLTFSVKERIKTAITRFNGRLALLVVISLAVFTGLGIRIYLDDHHFNKRINTDSELEQFSAESEIRYKRYEHTIQPRITDVKLEVDIFPRSLNFKAKGHYTLVNRSDSAIDTLLVNYSFKEKTGYSFSRPATLIQKDSLICFDILQLDQPLMPGDTLIMQFDIQNVPNTLFRTYSKVRPDGTFLRSSIFPGLGYRPTELTDNSIRAKYGLPEKATLKISPDDTSAIRQQKEARGWDMISFEAIVSTSPDQTAIAPGQLVKDWQEDGRRYFHYKLDSRIKPHFGIHSGRYSVKRERWNDIDLEVYYNESHHHNTDRMMDGLRASLEYNIRNFGPYQHRQASIIEFPKTEGTFGTVLGNSIPLSESRFIYDVREEKGADLPFYIPAHEIAHMWWGHQVVPEDVLGAKMVSETMAEYVAAKVLEHKQGIARRNEFLDYQRTFYLSIRKNQRRSEKPLLYNEGQRHINYNKGSVVLCMLADYLGEDRLNGALKAFLEKAVSNPSYYATSVNLAAEIQKITPDSLQYLIRDHFETVTFHDNKVELAKVTTAKGGKYRVEAEFLIRKYRVDEQWKKRFSDNGTDSLFVKEPDSGKMLYSLPLADYIEVLILGDDPDKGEKEILYNEKIKVTGIRNAFSVMLDKKPSEIIIDPDNWLIETSTEDNRMGFE